MQTENIGVRPRRDRPASLRDRVHPSAAVASGEGLEDVLASGTQAARGIKLHGGSLRVASAAAYGGAILGAGSVHSTDNELPQISYSLHSLCNAYPHLEVVLNYFDQAAPEERRDSRTMPRRMQSHPRIWTTWVPGMKTYFWKVVLTPTRVRQYAQIFVFDCDVAVHPSVFPLGAVAAMALATGASLVQPSTRAVVHGTHHQHLRVRLAHNYWRRSTCRP